MAKETKANIGFENQLWAAACELWGHIPAAEYRKVIVGLIFLRYISTAFENRYEQLVEEGDGFEEDKDEYNYPADMYSQELWQDCLFGKHRYDLRSGYAFPGSALEPCYYYYSYIVEHEGKECLIGIPSGLKESGNTRP